MWNPTCGFSEVSDFGRVCNDSQEGQVMASGPLGLNADSGYLLAIKCGRNRNRGARSMWAPQNPTDAAPRSAPGRMGSGPHARPGTSLPTFRGAGEEGKGRLPRASPTRAHLNPLSPWGGPKQRGHRDGEDSLACVALGVLPHPTHPQPGATLSRPAPGKRFSSRSQSLDPKFGCPWARLWAT